MEFVEVAKAVEISTPTNISFMRWKYSAVIERNLLYGVVFWCTECNGRILDKFKGLWLFILLALCATSPQRPCLQ